MHLSQLHSFNVPTTLPQQPLTVMHLSTWLGISSNHKPTVKAIQVKHSMHEAYQ
jgi:hypothetical protein